jgi:acyl carrier protein
MPNTVMSDQLKTVIREHLGVEESQVIESARFIEDLGADSLDALDLLMAVNEEFGTRIPAEQLTDILTVKDMVDAIVKDQS